ncbi:MAG: NAD(P)/FAD-dependent oxidoreductase [Bacteroidia bacterium]|nr:NAD(P)/FAD-dependent oxidoreductase [Bacteroidia bacterium]
MINIPSTDKKRVVIVGCGFAGLTLAKKLRKSPFQVVIIDKHNYHQFQPLFYEIASAGLDADSITFPIRKVFQKYDDFYIRKAEVKEVNVSDNKLITSIGALNYDYLVLAHGATNYFFGSDKMKQYSKGMKSIAEALDLRNTLLMNFENAVATIDEEERDRLLNITIIGGGPSGVEIAGALAEMNKYVIHKDYPELKNKKVNIYLIEGYERLLNTMSPESSGKARQFLEKRGVRVLTNTLAVDCDEKSVTLKTGEKIKTGLILWTAGISGNKVKGFSQENYGKGGRFNVDRFNRVKGYENIFAIGDISLMTEEKYPSGHPQVAQVAIQQAKLLSENLKNMSGSKPLKEFLYKDLGTMATVGKNLAVVELPHFHFHGVFAWFVWMFIHLMSIIGVRNKLLIFINWAWKYFTYDQSLRLILRPKGCA